MVSLFHQDTVSRGARNLIDDSYAFLFFLHQMFWLAFNNIFLEKKRRRLFAVGWRGNKSLP